MARSAFGGHKLTEDELKVEKDERDRFIVELLKKLPDEVRVGLFREHFCTACGQDTDLYGGCCCTRDDD